MDLLLLVVAPPPPRVKRELPDSTTTKAGNKSEQSAEGHGHGHCYFARGKIRRIIPTRRGGRTRFLSSRLIDAWLVVR